MYEKITFTWKFVNSDRFKMRDHYVAYDVFGNIVGAFNFAVDPRQHRNLTEDQLDYIFNNCAGDSANVDHVEYVGTCPIFNL